VLGALVWGLAGPARGAGASELTWVKIKGTLSVEGIIPRIGPPRVRVMLAARGKLYQLQFSNEQDRQRVEKLADGTSVVVSGWLFQGHVIQVVSLERGNRIPVIVGPKKEPGPIRPPKPEKVTIRVVRTPGVGDFGPRREWTLDSTKLSTIEHLRLRVLIDSASFFELRSSPLPLGIPDPPAGYQVTVTLKGRSNTIWVRDADVSKDLRRLIDHVRRTA
jgi:hypothetical protein